MNDIVILVLIGLSAGILSGLFGIGGGILIVPALVFLLGLSQHEAQGTSLGLMLLPIGILGAFNYYKSGNLNIKFAAIIAASFVLGAFLGSKVSLGISEVLLKKAFAVLMLIVSIKMLFIDK